MLSVKNDMADTIGANLARSKRPMGGHRETNKVTTMGSQRQRKEPAWLKNYVRTIVC